jgi:hypothetical protein
MTLRLNLVSYQSEHLVLRIVRLRPTALHQDALRRVDLFLAKLAFMLQMICLCYPMRTFQPRGQCGLKGPSLSMAFKTRRRMQRGFFTTTIVELFLTIGA